MALQVQSRTLAHHGVLFLDEFTESRRDAVEGLRQPLEDGRLVVTRMVGSVAFPSRFTLVADPELVARPSDAYYHQLRRWIDASKTGLMYASRGPARTH